MFRYPFLLFALFLSLCALRADVLQIAQTSITVPAPEGYVRVTEQMPLMQRFVGQMEDPQNDTLAVYITPQAAEIALEGKLPRLERYFFLKISKALVEPVVNTRDFDELRAVISAEQGELFAQAQERLPDLLAQIERNLADAFGAEVSMQIGEMVPLGVYLNESDVLAFSMLMHLGAGAEGEGDNVLVTSCVLLNVSGKVIFLYAYGGADALQWTQASSLAWARAIFAENPLAPKGRGSFNWNSVIFSGVAGAVIGVGIAALNTLRQKHRKAATR